MALKALYLSECTALNLSFSAFQKVFFAVSVKTCEAFLVVKDMHINVRVAPQDNRHEKEMVLTGTQHSG